VSVAPDGDADPDADREIGGAGPGPAGAAYAVHAHPPLPVRRGGPRSSTWWGRAWVRAVEEAAYDEADLRVARSLARTAAVGGISVAVGRLVAAVSDSRGLWTVDVRLPVLDSDGVAALVETVAARPGRVAVLLDGDLPHELVEHAEEAGVELLPSGGELEASCTCDAWVDPCPHALAVLHQVAWLLDAGPLGLLHLRGLPRDVLLARLHALESERLRRPGADDEGWEVQEAALDVAADAAARAAAVLARLEAAGDGDPSLTDLL